MSDEALFIARVVPNGFPQGRPRFSVVFDLNKAHKIFDPAVADFPIEKAKWLAALGMFPSLVSNIIENSFNVDIVVNPGQQPLKVKANVLNNNRYDPHGYSEAKATDLWLKF